MCTFSSRQIRPPIYSLKQSKLRKRRVIRFAILYFVILVVFIALIVGPLVARDHFELPKDLIPMQLLQPTGQNNNDTLSSETGTAVGGKATSTGSSDKLRLF